MVGPSTSLQPSPESRLQQPRSVKLEVCAKVQPLTRLSHQGSMIGERPLQRGHLRHGEGLRHLHVGEKPVNPGHLTAVVPPCEGTGRQAQIYKAMRGHKLYKLARSRVLPPPLPQSVLQLQGNVEISSNQLGTSMTFRGHRCEFLPHRPPA